MDALLKKRNGGQGPVVVLAAPEEFRSKLQARSAEAPVSDVMTGGAGHIRRFAMQQPEVESPLRLRSMTTVSPRQPLPGTLRRGA